MLSSGFISHWHAPLVMDGIHWHRPGCGRLCCRNGSLLAIFIFFLQVILFWYSQLGIGATAMGVYLRDADYLMDIDATAVAGSWHGHCASVGDRRLRSCILIGALVSLQRAWFLDELGISTCVGSFHLYSGPVACACCVPQNTRYRHDDYRSLCLCILICAWVLLQAAFPWDGRCTSDGASMTLHFDVDLDVCSHWCLGATVRCMVSGWTWSSVGDTPFSIAFVQ